MKLDPETDLVDVTTAARISGYSRTAVQMHMDSGRVRCWKIGAYWALYKPDVLSLKDFQSDVGRPREVLHRKQNE